MEKKKVKNNKKIVILYFVLLAFFIRILGVAMVGVYSLSTQRLMEICVVLLLLLGLFYLIKLLIKTESSLSKFNNTFLTLGIVGLINMILFFVGSDFIARLFIFVSNELFVSSLISEVIFMLVISPWYLWFLLYLDKTVKKRWLKIVLLIILITMMTRSLFGWLFSGNLLIMLFVIIWIAFGTIIAIRNIRFLKNS